MGNSRTYRDKGHKVLMPFVTSSQATAAAGSGEIGARHNQLTLPKPFATGSEAHVLCVNADV